MKILGIELNAKEAVVCLMASEAGLFNVMECRTRGIELRNPETAEGIRGFQFQMIKLIDDYSIDKVVIKQRHAKGKFAGSTNSFKMEAAIQLIDSVSVEMINPTEIKETLKKNPLDYNMKDLELRKFQEDAFYTAYTFALRDL